MSDVPLPQISGQRVVRALEKVGFIVRRQKGSHVILVHSQDLSRRTIVPLHGSKPVKPGTLRAILKGAVISLEEERKFWDTHSITEFTDELKDVKIEFVRPRKKLVSLRLDTRQIESLKEITSGKGFGYLTLMRLWITERLSRERRPTHVHR